VQNETELWSTVGKDPVQVGPGGNPAYSPATAGPNVGKIAFGRFDGQDTEIWVSDRDGSNPQQITNNTFEDDTPAWSDDGLRLVYVSEGPGNAELFLYTFATGALTRLTDNTWEDRSPDWHGHEIAYQSMPPATNDYEIFTVRDDLTQNPVQLTSNGLDDEEPRWSAGGTQIVFSRAAVSGAHDIWIMNSTGGSQTNLTNHTAHDREAELSPDGALIIFVSDRSGTERLWVMKADGSVPLILRTSQAGSRHPRWRP
jgi:TolB protein